MTAEQAAAPLDRVLTIPNAISTARILLVPVFAWAAVVERSPYTINALLIAIGVSDFFDGWVARRLGQESRLGAVLDPVGDRLAVVTALVIFLAKGWIPLLVAAVILLREVAVSVGATVLGALGVPRFDVTFEGKLATLLLLVALPFFTVAGSDYSWHVPAAVTAYSFAIPGVLFAYYSAWQYAGMARDSWPQRRVGSEA